MVVRPAITKEEADAAAKSAVAILDRINAILREEGAKAPADSLKIVYALARTTGGILNRLPEPVRSIAFKETLRLISASLGIEMVAASDMSHKPGRPDA